MAEFKVEDEEIAAAFYRKIEFRKSAQESADRKYDGEMKKRVGRDYAAALQRVTKLKGHTCGRCGKICRGEGLLVSI